MFIETPKANPETPEIKIPGRYHELAQAIRKGCESTRQSYGLTYFKDVASEADAHACALGAAGLATGFAFDPMDFRMFFELHEHLTCEFPELLDHYGGLTIWQTIIIKNDGDRESREAIAGWLDSL